MTIRAGKKEDLPRVLELINELAAYVKAPNAVVNTVKMMEDDGFGNDPVFGFFVAENSETIIGIAVYYYRYSTWQGKTIYLEDMIVTEKERGKGVGKKLFDRTMQHGKENGCTGMSWQVLEWNEPAINFYRKYYNAKFDPELINCSVSF